MKATANGTGQCAWALCHGIAMTRCLGKEQPAMGGAMTTAMAMPEHCSMEFWLYNEPWQCTMATGSGTVPRRCHVNVPWLRAKEIVEFIHKSVT